MTNSNPTPEWVPTMNILLEIGAVDTFRKRRAGGVEEARRADDALGAGALARMGASCALAYATETYRDRPDAAALHDAAMFSWPVGAHEFPRQSGRDLLVLAAANIVAEIERLDRAARKDWYRKSFIVRDLLQSGGEVQVDMRAKPTRGKAK